RTVPTLPLLLTRDSGSHAVKRLLGCTLHNIVGHVFHGQLLIELCGKVAGGTLGPCIRVLLKRINDGALHLKQYCVVLHSFSFLYANHASERYTPTSSWLYQSRPIVASA